MSLGQADLRMLMERAARAAGEAGAFMSSSRPTTITHKSTGESEASSVVTEIDRGAEDIILEILAPTIEQFDLGVLTEERPDTGERLVKEHFWCIDPLDGTLPFVEGSPGFAVSIALVARDGAPALGVVFDPTNDVSYCAARGLGVTKNGSPWKPDAVATGRRISVFLDRSAAESLDHRRVTDALEAAAKDMGLEGIAVHVGAGAVMSACQVLERPPACYFKLPKPQEGGGSLWDFAATSCLFHESGASATDMRGTPLDLNRRDSTFMNHRGVLFATDPALADHLLTITGAVPG